VVTGTLVFEGDGQVRDYVGGYDDWVRQAGNRGALSSVQDRPSSAAAPAIRTRKRTNKEREEWAGLPRRIESLEAELDTLTRVMSDASFFQRSAAEVRAKRERMEALPAELDAAYARWQELDDQSK
ncbi:MAG: ABC transporter ATP-binding protein, partial [Kiritimatiellia bacterium]|nr:ABC transporter ATP-binding protein [Kiritimatiellia bacterium]